MSRILKHLVLNGLASCSFLLMLVRGMQCRCGLVQWLEYQQQWPITIHSLWHVLVCTWCRWYPGSRKSQSSMMQDAHYADPLPLLHVNVAMLQLSRVEFVHARSFIHRYIKPDNFLMGLGKKAKPGQSVRPAHLFLGVSRVSSTTNQSHRQQAGLHVTHYLA